LMLIVFNYTDQINNKLRAQRLRDACRQEGMTNDDHGRHSV
jgi:hypothetical protein